MNKIKKIAKKFYSDTRYFSISLAILHFKETLTRYTAYKMPAKDYLKKDNIVLTYLSEKYNEVVLDEAHYPLEKQDENRRIWVFWYQGESSMPPIVRETYRSIKANANGHEVVLITKLNIDTYIDVPSIIKKRVLNKNITLAQYSDIIRACLLSQYGGLWMDATVLVTRTIPEEVFEVPFFTIANAQDQKNPLFYISVAHLRWTTYVFGGSPHNPLFEYMRSVLIAYNSTEESLIDYLLIDYVIELAWRQSDVVKSMFENVSLSNQNKEELVHRLDATFPDEITRKLLFSSTQFFKLSYKRKLQANSKRQTNYKLLVEQTFLKAYGVGDGL
ncbi:capsular polysaccharide synthesis protein [Lactiplantibacillus songbeiensis]|uniref:Capsular polysaccharide synthesis protein n=1 Tax=Lactiplantibacillus songbeiensis TaxID=2559920 RepID=A0ABW4C3C9_9LACO|nr:capsular polysaccharide synthesis protein [Lactiplantibacillus songbeiensis]